MKDSDIKRIVDRYRALRLLDDDPDDIVKRLSTHADDLRDAIEEINSASLSRGWRWRSN